MPGNRRHGGGRIAKVIIVGNYYEETGLLCKFGLIDCDLMLNMLSGSIVEMWNTLSDVTSRDWLARHGNGTYPANVRRIELQNRWREGNEQHTSSLVT